MINRNQIILLLALFQFSALAQQHYQIDNKKSKILWKVESVGKHNGYLLFRSGTLNYSNKDEPVGGNFIMDMKSIRSLDRPTAKGRAEIDKELQSIGFFNVGVYANATMEVTQLIATPSPSIYRVNGKLTMKGITKPIEFNAAIHKKGDVISIKANLKIARLKWHIDMQEKPDDFDFLSAVKDKMMPDDIFITLDLTFNK